MSQAKGGAVPAKKEGKGRKVSVLVFSRHCSIEETRRLSSKVGVESLPSVYFLSLKFEGERSLHPLVFQVINDRGSQTSR